MELDFSAAFDRVSHCVMLYKLRSIGAGRQFLSIASEFLSDRRQRVRLDDKVNASVNIVSGLPKGGVLEPLLFIFRMLGNYIVGYVGDTTIYAVIPRPLLRTQVMKSQNKNSAEINSMVFEMAHGVQS